MNRRLTWIVMIAVTLLPAVLAHACPMCKDSIPNSEVQQTANIPGGFNASVYYMLTGLFVTLGMCVGVITKGVYNTNARMSTPSKAQD